MELPFIHLRVHSDYSLGYGAIKLPDLIIHCQNNNLPAVALSDRYNLFASLEFSQAAIKAGVQPIISCVISIIFEENGFEKPSIGELLLIAKNHEGYNNLLWLVSESYMNSASKDGPRIFFNDLKEHADGLIILCGTMKSPVGIMLSQKRFEEAKSFLKQLKLVAQDNLYLELIRRGIKEENDLEIFLLEQALELDLPIVATNEVCFLKPGMSEAHDALICIVEGKSIYDEQRVKSHPENYLKSSQEMRRLFNDLPEALENTANIAKRVSVYSESRPPLLPRCNSEEVDENEEIDQQAKIGLTSRLRNVNLDQEIYFNRLNTELAVIKRMNFSGYFLIVSDFIKWAKRQGIPVGPGRGSGAGSMVAWALEITDVDPIRFGLLFERFLNPERVSMPDFDIDFCQDRRDEVIKYVNEKYGYDRVASIITYGKLQARAVLRDVGRVIGMGFNETDRICKMVPNNPANPVTLQQAIDLDKELQNSRNTDPRIKKLLDISLQLEGMNRHVSTHAAGIVISDRPLWQLVPLYKDNSSTMPVIQYGFKYAEIAGLVKFDFLGLKTLTMISSAVLLINKHSPDFTLSKAEFDDGKTYELLSRGKTIGIFQFESAGMREAIKKLKPDCIEDLIALGSLYRPGPMDNIPSYINRKHGYEKPEYIHPMLEGILKETYGIIVYQEQVIQIAQVMAGYSLGGADLLRRAMGKKDKAEMESQRDAFVKGSIKNGVFKHQAEDIFILVDKFASYGFNKSHAAAYAIISYQTAFLKANYPIEFLVASMNLEINDTEKIQLFCEEAKSLDIKVLPPDINYSNTYCSVEGAAIRYGLAAIKNVGAKAIEEMVEIREKDGKFIDLDDFITRCGKNLNKRMLEKLISSGAMNSINSNQAELYGNCEVIIQYASGMQRHQLISVEQKSLFGGEQIDSRVILKEYEPWTEARKLEAELEALGFYLSKHPLEIFRKSLERKTVFSGRMTDYATKKGAKISVAGVITSKKIRSSARGKYAFIQMSDLQGLFEVSIFNEDLLNKHNDDLQVGQSLYIVIDAKKDDNGARFVVDEIMQLSEFVAGLKIIYDIHAVNPIDIKRISFVENGYQVKLATTVDGHTLYFRSKKPLYISAETLAQLRVDQGFIINELI
jgi:DNA polymerase-3 subunit alpha